MINEEIIKLYNENKSTVEISKILGTYPNLVRRTLLANGISLRSHSQAQINAINFKGHQREGKKNKKGIPQGGI